MFDKSAYEIRLMDCKDEKLVYSWRTQDRVHKKMYSDHLISLDEHKSWFARALGDTPNLYLICCYKKKPIGFISFSKLNDYSSTCYWGFYLGENGIAPKGSGFVMEMIALEYAFEVINIRKLCCEVFSFNKSVIKLHQKFGFKQESLLKQHCLKDSEYRDVIGLALFRQDWLSIKQEIIQKYF